MAGHLPALEEAVLEAAKVSFRDYLQNSFFYVDDITVKRGVEMAMFVHSGLQEAFTRIDLRSHEGGHPRWIDLLSWNYYF